MVDAENAEFDQAQGFILVEPKVKILCWKEEEGGEDEKLKETLDAVDNYDPSWDDFIDDDDDQGSTRLLIEDQHHKSSSSGKKHADHVFLTQPTVIYLNAPFEGETEVSRSRAEMLEELGLEDRNFKFDIEDEIPSSPEKVYKFKYAHEADNFNDVIDEEGLDSSEEDTPFHYSGVDDSFPTLAEMFKEQN
ncbi:hypothetical protein Hanom_Chr12g01133841 [Helianthus anomalus]